MSCLPTQAALRNVEGFETYASTVQLQAAWTNRVGSPSVALETTTVCEGTKALALTYSGATSPFTNLVRFTFGTLQNWATNSTFQFSYGGLANSNDTVVVRLLDPVGNVIKGTNIVGGTTHSPCRVATINLAGVPNINAVRSIELGVIGSDSANTGTVFFDALKVGDLGLLSVLGSSLGKGFGASGQAGNQTTNGSYLNSYAARLTTTQPAYGWRVTNQSIGGDTTTAVINRFYRDEVPVAPTANIIALSLGNEGLPGAVNPQAVFDKFFTGITNIIALSRSNNIFSVVGNGYPRDAYSATEYTYLKRMDLLLNTLDVPSINFLGATDDGYGHWVNNSFINLNSGDGIHPNDAGYFEMFLTIVPSVFEAVRQGKPTPQWGSRTNVLRIVGDSTQRAPLSLDTTLMHSFSVSFRVRATGTGTVASATLASGINHPTIEILPEGIAYRSVNGAVVNSGVNGTNGLWHDVVIAHQYARGITAFYVDGLLVTNVTERLTPINFVLGGPGNAVSRPGSPAQADYQDWFVHRSMLNFEEVTAQAQGQLQQASLELYAPLTDATLVQGGVVTNVAQSLTAAKLNAATLNVSSVLVSMPPSKLLLATNSAAEPEILLNWINPPSTKDAYYVERSPEGGAWTEIAILPGDASSYTDTEVGIGTNYQYRVSYESEGQRSGYAVSAMVKIPQPIVPPSIEPDAVLVDFGRHDGGANGEVTSSPDAYGHYWNNMGTAAMSVAQNYFITNLVNATNGPTTYSVRVLSSTFQCNGFLNGGLLDPDVSLLGSFAIPTATGDYFFLNNGASGVSGTLRISGLNPARKYKFSMFATRNTDASTIRTTRYSVTDVNGLHTVTLQTSGPGAGSAARPYGNDDTIVTLNGLVPNLSGELDLVVSEVNGLFAYLGVLQIALADDSPVFVLNPQSIVAPANTATSLTAFATSPLPVSYQWYFENSPIAGATDTNLPLPSLNVSDVGSYFVVASNSVGMTTSAVATVALALDHLNPLSVLIDFGRHDGGVNGAVTLSPDHNGNYWNNIGTASGTVAQNSSIMNLVTIKNQPTTIGLTVLSSTFQANGYLNGGLLTPDASLIGDFAVPTATGDYFYLNGNGLSGTLRLSGLDPTKKYNLGIFATRTTDASSTRISRYFVMDVNGLHSVELQTSGPGSGSPAQPYGNNDTIVTLNGLTPNPAGMLDLVVMEVAGSFAYIGVLQIVPAASSNFLPPTAITGGWQLQLNATPGYAYRVQRATEATGPWEDLATIVAPESGLIVFDDTNAPASQAFYRAVSL